MFFEELIGIKDLTDENVSIDIEESSKGKENASLANDLRSVRIYSWKFGIHLMFAPVSFIWMQIVKQWKCYRKKHGKVCINQTLLINHVACRINIILIVIDFNILFFFKNKLIYYCVTM